MGRGYCDKCFPGQRQRYLRAYWAEPENKARDLARQRGEYYRTRTAARRADPERKAAKAAYDRAHPRSARRKSG